MYKKIAILLVAFCLVFSNAVVFAAEEPEAETPTIKLNTETETTVNEKSEETTDEIEPPETLTEEDSENSENSPAAASTEEQTKEESQEAQEEVNTKEEPVEPEVTEQEEIEEETEVVFEATKEDYIAYDPLYIMEYANPKYVNVDEIDLSAFYDIPTAAKGIATYNVKKQADFDVTEKNFIAGLTYDMPLYDVDPSSKYYVAIPDVNLFNKNFKAYDIAVAYNNDYAEMISGYKYEKGILYVPKKAVDRPKNDNDVPEGSLIAVQLNYAIGGDMDFSKDIPVQVLSSEEPKNLTVHTNNIFDRDILTVKTGIKGRKTSDVSVYVNGSLIPITDEGWTYDKSSGEVSITLAPGVVSGINIVFNPRNLREKISDTATSMVESFMPSAQAAVSMEDMVYFKDSNGNPVELEISNGDLFVGYRGFYNAKYMHGSSKSKYNDMMDCPGWENSVYYLYGGEVKKNSQDAAKADATWAFSSYAIAYDMVKSGSDGSLTKNEQVEHDGESMTIYEWLLYYRNSLEKSNEVWGGGEKWKTKTNNNGIGGYNNFCFTFPKKITGCDKSLVSSGPDVGKENPSLTITSDVLTGGNSVYYNYWLAAGCNHLAMAEAAEDEGSKDSSIYVTCLGLTDEYAVLAFVQSNSEDYTQNACAIYKFKISSPINVSVSKKSGNAKVSGGNAIYSLKDTTFKLYKSAADAKANKDAVATFVMGADGSSTPVKISRGTYYLVETKAGPGFIIPDALKASGGGKAINCTATTTINV